MFLHSIRGSNGVLPLNVGSGAPSGAISNQGLLLDSDGKVYASATVPPVRFCGGIPYDADGRLVIEDGPVAYYNQGLPFTASHALAVASSESVGYYGSGVAFTADGLLAVSGLGPPPPQSNVALFAMATPDIVELYRMDTDPWSLVAHNIPNIADLTTVISARFSAPPKLLALNNQAAGRVWKTDAFPFTFFASYLGIGDSGPRNAAFSPDGTRMLVDNLTGIRVYTTSDFSVEREIAVSLTAPTGTSTTIFNHDGSLIVTSTSIQQWAVIDGSGALGGLPLPELVGSLRQTAAHPSRNVFVIVEDAVGLHVYDYDAGIYRGLLPFTATSTLDVDFSPNGRLIAIHVGGTARLHVYDCSDLDNPAAWTPIPVEGPAFAGLNSRYALDWSHDGAFILTRSVSSAAPPMLRAYSVSESAITPIPNFHNGTSGAGFGGAFLSDVPLPAL